MGIKRLPGRGRRDRRHQVRATVAIFICTVPAAVTQEVIARHNQVTLALSWLFRL